MKRPWQVYLIALWILINLSEHIGMICGVVFFGISKMLGQYPPDPRNPWFGLTLIPGIPFFVITLVRLIQLHTLGIIASVILLLVACAYPIFVLFACSSIILFSAGPLSSELLSTVFMQLSFLMLNLVCIWYLSRRTFRNYCKRFVEEKRLDLLQRENDFPFLIRQKKRFSNK
jgi:hypothetical protein